MIKNTIYFLLFFVSVFSFYSCQEEGQQLLNPDLKAEELSLENLSENKDFIAYTKANVEFFNNYDKWYNNLSNSEKITYDNKIANALENRISGDLKPPHLSDKQYTTFKTQQAGRVSAVIAKYPELKNIEEGYKVVSSAFHKTMAIQNIHFVKSGMTIQNAGLEDACFEGYNACSWDAYDKGVDPSPCYAGYIACKNAKN